MVRADAQGPHVARDAIRALLVELLRRPEPLGAHLPLCGARRQVMHQSKVAEPCVPVGVEEYVLVLEVPVDKAVGVEDLQAKESRTEVELDLLLGEAGLGLLGVELGLLRRLLGGLFRHFEVVREVAARQHAQREDEVLALHVRVAAVEDEG